MGRVIVFSFFVIFNASPGLSQDSTSIDLTDFSLEELLDVEVVSISRKAESVQRAAAAVFVISAEDIRRSGAHSIPEVLRLAPGLNVARISSSSWAITSRGFNSRFANKLQVLVDGRSIYSTMFSGVYWEASPVMLEDIERIEIIRGPGATMWGANAVNGVINIITKKPDQDDPASMVALMTGTKDLYRSAWRVDGGAGEFGSWRLSSQFKKHDSFTTDAGDEANDAWDEYLARLRWDQQLGERDNLTVSGHYYQSHMEYQYLDVTPGPPYSQIEEDVMDFRTASFQTIWARELSETSGMKLGLYFSHFDHNQQLLHEIQNIADVDFQHNFNISSNQAVIWGGSWRYHHDHMNGSPAISFNPDSVDGQVFSVFFQDDWSIVPDRLNLILGGKWEYRKETGDQGQPNVRMTWTPTEKTTWWGSVARAVRVPSRINRDIQMDMAMVPPGAMFPGSPTMSTSMIGSDSMKPEELVAFETGFRFKPNGRLSLELVLFLNEYDKLRILEMGEMQPHPIYGPPIMMMPLEVSNGAGGRTQGGELTANWKPSSGCRFQLAYSYWDFKGAHVAPHENNGMGRMVTPKHQVSLRGLFTPAKNWETDFWFRFTDDLMADPEDVTEWNELDLRVAWTPIARLRLTMGGRNLLHDNHQEFIYRNTAPNPTRIERSGYLEFQWNF